MPLHWLEEPTFWSKLIRHMCRNHWEKIPWNTDHPWKKVSGFFTITYEYLFHEKLTLYESLTSEVTPSASFFKNEDTKISFEQQMCSWIFIFQWKQNKTKNREIRMIIDEGNPIWNSNFGTLWRGGKAKQSIQGHL